MLPEILCKNAFKGFEEMKNSYNKNIKSNATKDSKKHIILTITGASAAGKDSLVDAIMYLNKQINLVNCKSVANLVKLFQTRNINNSYRELVSHTTRKPRVGEIDGIDYYYIDKAEFDKIEKVESTEYAGNYYCLSADELKKIKDVGIVIVDKEGVKHIHKYVEEHSDEYIHLSIFLRINAEQSRNRMIARGDKEESIEKRLKQQEEKNEYSPNGFDFSIVLESGDEQDFLYNVVYIQEALNFIYNSL